MTTFIYSIMRSVMGSWEGFKSKWIIAGKGYDFDECRTTQTCQELERLEQLNMGE